MDDNGMITLSRDCPVVLIPSGEREMLKKGAQVTITQTLGGAFTVQTRTGLLVRIDGRDADVLGKEVVEAKASSKDSHAFADEKDVWDVLKTIYDPEIPVNIVELGLIYDCKLTNMPKGGTRVDVVMTLTAPGCGMGQILKEDIEAKLSALDGVRQQNVEVTFEPPWEQSKMSEAAKLELGMM